MMTREDRRRAESFCAVQAARAARQLERWASTCTRCGAQTENAPVPFYFNLADPTEATWQVVCDGCRATRPAPADYAAPFADGDEDEQ
jgi:hypothetical protein